MFRKKFQGMYELFEMAVLNPPFFKWGTGGFLQKPCSKG
ncbi:MAG: hypothetical protein H6Q44_1127 [Deltaproteobacteria bacterium]|nr:hypothetical protein [Deltaproteobacteria bacterium]